MSASLEWLVPLVICPVCRGGLRFSPDGGPEDGFLEHAGASCGEEYPVIGSIPRLLTGVNRGRLVDSKRTWFAFTARRGELAKRWRSESEDRLTDAVVRGFDYEWTHFSVAGTPHLRAVAERYFEQIPAELFAAAALALDAGSGSGRWALEIAKRGPRVIAVDLGLSIDVAHANTRDTGRVACLQADLRELPLARGCVDWAYSLGVMHHVDRPRDALARVAAAVRPSGLVLVYLYYALDNRGPAYRALFRLSDAVRRVVSRLPRRFAYAFALAVAVLVYLPLARASALAAGLGLRRFSDALPLSFYRDLPLQVMRNDSLDRFGTTLEGRYRRDEVIELMAAAGLKDIHVSPDPPYWHAVGLVATAGSGR